MRLLLGQLVGDAGGSFSAGRVRQGHRGIVAEDDGRVLGFLYGSFLDLSIEKEGGGYIDLLVVGQGREVSPSGFVSTTEALQASSFYERCGFTRCRGPWLVWSAATSPGYDSGLGQRFRSGS
jgi:hypothetical protein